MNRDIEAYGYMISTWFDDCSAKINEFKSKFPDTGEGQLRYLMSLEIMLAEFCEEHSLPRELFSGFLTTLTALWYARGKPEHFSFTSISREEMEKLRSGQIH